MIWRQKTHDKGTVDALTAKGISPLASALLANRGITPEQTPSFLAPRLSEMTDPLRLKDMGRAAELVADAIYNNARIFGHFDYDADGVSSAALITTYMREAGADFIPYLPTRAQGYGLRATGIQTAVAAGAKLIITADCGITAVEEAILCRHHGIKLVITDHHLPGDILPDADAVVNPCRNDDEFPYKGLAGVGVAFYLLIAVRRILREKGHRGGDIDLRLLLQFVALGTIADVSPLTGENRILVRSGMSILESEPCVGLGHLMTVAGLGYYLTAQDVAFRLAPRINAAGRLSDPITAFNLLIATDYYEAEELALALDAFNRQRQEMEAEILEQAEEEIARSNALGRKAIVLAGHWPHGIIGITAGKLCERHNRPVILFSVEAGQGRGSGRSIPDFHLRSALDACGHLLVGFGGHAQAAGATIDLSRLDAFREAFCRLADDTITDTGMEPVLDIDMELDGTQISRSTIAEFSTLAPFGEGNPEPIFALRKARLIECRTMKEKHVSLTLKAGLKTVRAVGFNMAPPPVGTTEIDLAFALTESEWNGEIRVNPMIKDMISYTV